MEATPAESTTYRLAKHDVARYPSIITAAKTADETPYYTNSSHLPVGYTHDVFDALDIQDGLQTLYTSGTVFHAFLGEKMSDWKAAANLVRKIAENYSLPYYTLSPTYSICREHGYINGEVYECPDCGKKTEVYSRITGYYRPVQNWNAGKSQEFKHRQDYIIEKSILKHGNVDITAEEKCECAKEVKRVMLFTSATCPNCKVAKMLLDKEGIVYETLLATDNADLARGYDVKQAPTLVIETEDGFVKYAGVAQIKEFIAQKKAV